MRKKAFTLIEVLVSSLLLTLLLGTLFFSYRTLSKEKRNHIFLEEKYFEKKMTAIFDKVSTPFFTTEKSEVVFTYDRGPHLNPLLSGKVLAKLYLDRNGLLCLCIWPHPETEKQEPSETIVLLDHVDQLTLSFYYPPREPKNTVDPKEVGKDRAPKGWNGSWSQKYDDIPLFAQMIIRQGKEEKEFRFDLPSNKVITY